MDWLIRDIEQMAPATTSAEAADRPVPDWGRPLKLPKGIR